MSERVTWSTEQRKVSDLIPWPRNPRRISKPRMDQLQASLKKFGYADPVIANVDNQLIAGHMRLKAMALLKMVTQDTLVDVRIPSRRLTEEEASELAVRHNGKFGEWNMDMLSADFTTNELLDWGFSEMELGLQVPAFDEEKDKGKGAAAPEENPTDAPSETRTNDKEGGVDETEPEQPKDYSLQVLCESEGDRNKVIALCQAYRIRFTEGR